MPSFRMALHHARQERCSPDRHPQPSGFSSNPVQYGTGIVALSFTDLPSDNSGLPTGLTRSWTNGPSYSTGNYGSGMVYTQLPHLVQVSGGSFMAVANGTTVNYFDPNGSGGYTERYYNQDVFVVTPGIGVNSFTETDQRGDSIVYNNFSSSLPTAQQGTFKSFTDPNGNSLSVTSLTTAGLPAEVQYASLGGGGTVTQSYVYSYLSSGPNTGLLSSVVLRHKVGLGSWTTVQQVVYGYYDGSETYGNVGDMEFATVEDASANVLDTTYYRYYTSDTSTGYTHGLEYLFRPASYARLTAAAGHECRFADRQPGCPLRRQRVPVQFVGASHPGNRCRRRQLHEHEPRPGHVRLQLYRQRQHAGHEQLGDEDDGNAARRHQQHRLHQRSQPGDAQRLRRRLQQQMGHLLRVRHLRQRDPGGSAVGRNGLRRQLRGSAALLQRQLCVSELEQRANHDLHLRQ